jgi:excisionase family DNA binding protein
MSSKIEVLRICQHCGREFKAKTTVTKYCSHKCSQKAYKDRKRQTKIRVSNTETKEQQTQTIEEIKAKPFLSVQEAAILLGVSKRTIYRMIQKEEIIPTKARSRTIIQRANIDRLFKKPFKPQKVTQPKQETLREFYTVKEVEEKYCIKYSRLNTIIKERDIPKFIIKGRLHVSKWHIDQYFRQTRKDTSHITEWYTVSEIQEKYLLSRDQVYSRVHDNRIPKKRNGKHVKISKYHFDQLFKNAVVTAENSIL